MSAARVHWRGSMAGVRGVALRQGRQLGSSRQATWVCLFKRKRVQAACTAEGVFGARVDGAQVFAYSGSVSRVQAG